MRPLRKDAEVDPALQAMANASIQGGPLALFGKTVTIGKNGNYPDGLTPTVTITSLAPDALARDVFGPDLTLNQDEKISVFFSRDATYAGGRTDTPIVGETLVVTGDTDQRPYVFRGETRNVGDTNQEFVYQRPKKVAASGKR